MTNPLTLILNDLNYEKSDLTRGSEKDSVLSSYNSYIIDLIFSNDISTIITASEANSLKLTDKQMHYDYYLNALPKKKRYIPFNKAQKIEELEAVSKYFRINKQIAKSYLKLLNDDQLEQISKKAKYL